MENLEGSGFADTLTGDAGVNILIGGAGADVLSGDAGTDTASYSTALAGVTANLASPAANAGDAAGDTYSSIENLTGSAFADTLTGDSGANSLDGEAGNDFLVGGAGNDYILGGAGNDTILFRFGDGIDTIDGGVGVDTFNIEGTAANNTVTVLYGGASIISFGATTFAAVELFNLSLLAGMDTLGYGATTSSISVNLGLATATGFASISSVEHANGGSGNDALVGDAGANILNGNNGADVLDGGGGADTLNGGAGSDRLIGGAGNDQLNGGPDNDVFVFNPGFGADTITGFDENPSGGQDLLDISALGITSGNFATSVTMVQSGATVIVTIGSTSITLIGETVSNFSAQDFILGP